MTAAADRRHPEGAVLFATYNIRRALGRDGSRDAGRIARVVREIGPDVVAIQEIDSAFETPGPGHQFELLRDELGGESVLGVTLRRADAAYGNAVFTRLPVRAVRRHDISVAPAEPRGVVDLDLDLSGTSIRFLATHLGLRARERESQMAVLADLIDRDRGCPLVVAGDFNEWRAWSRAIRRLERGLGVVARPRAFPSAWPLLRLDRILARRRDWELLRSWAHDTPLARTASDHLPVCAWLRIREPAAEPPGSKHPRAT